MTITQADSAAIRQRVEETGFPLNTICRRANLTEEVVQRMLDIHPFRQSTFDAFMTALEDVEAIRSNNPFDGGQMA